MRPVLLAVVYRDPRRHRGAYVFTAELEEWEPRARCYVCAKIEARLNKDAPRCERCEGTGAIGDFRRAEMREGGERHECPRCEGRGYIVEVRVRRADCERCGGEGYVGSRRPPGDLLAIDYAWSDEGHVRIISERTKRRKGEALYRAHACAA